MTRAGLVLPLSPRRAGLTAFGVTMALWAAVVVGAVVPLGLAPRVGAAVLAGVVVTGAFRVRPRETTAVYRLWVRASRLYARIVRRVLLILCHAVLSLVGLAGTSMLLARPPAGRSLWSARETLPTTAYGSQFDTPAPAWTGRPWRAVVDWGIRSRNPWLLCLVPFLFLVSILDANEEQARYPAGIYTLF